MCSELFMIRRKNLWEDTPMKFVERKSVDICSESVPAVESTSCRCPEYTVPLPLFRRSIPELVIEFVRRASEPTISPFNIASFGSRSFDLREYLWLPAADRRPPTPLWRRATVSPLPSSPLRLKLFKYSIRNRAEINRIWGRNLLAKALAQRAHRFDGTLSCFS